MIKFSQLKTEILQSLSHPHQLIKLTDELNMACTKYSKVKELFWKVNFCFYTFLFLENLSLRIRIYLFIMLHNIIRVLKLYQIRHLMMIPLIFLFQLCNY